MKIKRVHQEQKFGCMIAALAMVTSRDYWEVARSFDMDFDRRGCPRYVALQYLADAGFAVIVRELVFYNNVRAQRREMLKPFATAHIVGVTPFVGQRLDHALVMDCKGVLIDTQPETTKKDIDNIYQIRWIAGVYAS